MQAAEVPSAGRRFAHHNVCNPIFRKDSQSGGAPHIAVTTAMWPDRCLSI